MSGERDEQEHTRRHDTDEPAWLAAVWTVAVDCARRAGLGDFAADLAQLLSIAVLERGAAPFDAAWTRARAEELVDEERSARRAKAQLEQRAADIGLDIRGLEVTMRSHRSGVPRLVPRLGRIADLHPQATAAKTMLWRAAVSVAREPGVLSGDQFRLYYLAWLEQIDIDEIAGLLHLRPSDRNALRKRLSRISSRIERALVRRLRQHVDPLEWRWLQAAMAGIDTAPNPAAWTLVTRGLDRIALRTSRYPQ